jgi:hypothetical protein
MRAIVAALFVFAASIAAAQESSDAKVAAQDKAAQDKAAAEAKATAEAKAAASPSPEARRGVRPGDVQKVFVLKHVHVNDLARLLSVFPAEISGMERDTTRVLSVSANPAVVAAIEETVKRLDVPPPPIRSVEITAYILECSTSGDAGTLPQDLQGVFVQLKKTFNYSGCGLARTLFARGSDDSRLATEFNERAAGTYQLMGRIEVDSSVPPTVRLRGIDLANFNGSQRSRLNGDVEMRDGQKVVLGRLGTTESGKDQIVVLTAKVAP